MPRTTDQLPQGANNFPPKGKYPCRCIGAVPRLSKEKKTPYAELTWTTRDGLYVFTDSAYVTPKAISRLALIAKRVCGATAEMEWADDNEACAKQLARFICDNATGRDALVTIEENDETFMHTAGPKIGQKDTKTRSRVAYSGYDMLPDEEPTDPPPDEEEPTKGEDDPDSIPF